MDLRGSETTLVALGVLEAALLLISTGAVIVDQPSDPIHNEVALQPGDNPQIDAGGLVDTVATQEALFYITYEGDEPSLGKSIEIKAEDTR